MTFLMSEARDLEGGRVPGAKKTGAEDTKCAFAQAPVTAPDSALV